MDRGSLSHAMSAWGRRYRRVGACIGLVVGYLMSATIPHLLMNLILGPVVGAVVGTVFGMMGGALAHRRRPDDAPRSETSGERSLPIQ
jgi:uncharacterized protein YqgC (DUF456 family)